MHKYQTILVVYMVNHAQRKREFGSSNLDGGGSLHQGEDGHPLCGGASRFDAYRIQYVAYSALQEYIGGYIVLSRLNSDHRHWSSPFSDEDTSSTGMISTCDKEMSEPDSDSAPGMFLS